MLSHNVMRAALLGFVGLVASTTSVGCGPGLTRHSQAAKAPAQPDVFVTMDAELKNAVASTTTVTSAEDPMPLPESRLPVAQWDGDEPAPTPPPATWGAPQVPSLEASPGMGVAPVSNIPAEIPAKRDPLSYP